MYESEELRTDVDDFIDLVKKQEKISVPEAARALNVNVSTIEQWADFLEEEKIIGRDYKFTTAYIYYNEINKNLDGNLSFETKEEFFRKAMDRSISTEKIKILWMKYVERNKEKIKYAFFKKASIRNIDKTKIPSYWMKYYEKLIE